MNMFLNVITDAVAFTIGVDQMYQFESDNEQIIDDGSSDSCHSFDPEPSDEIEPEEISGLEQKSAPNETELNLKEENRSLRHTVEEMKAHNKALILALNTAAAKKRAPEAAPKPALKERVYDAKVKVENTSLKQENRNLQRFIESLQIKLEATKSNAAETDNNGLHNSLKILSLILQYTQEAAITQLQKYNPNQEPELDFNSQYRHTQALKFKLKFPRFNHISVWQLVGETRDVPVKDLDYKDFYKLVTSPDFNFDTQKYQLVKELILEQRVKESAESKQEKQNLVQELIFGQEIKRSIEPDRQKYELVKELILEEELSDAEDLTETDIDSQIDLFSDDPHNGIFHVDTEAITTLNKFELEPMSGPRSPRFNVVE